MTSEDKPHRVSFCPYCGGSNLKFVGSYGGVPRCMDCLVGFFVQFSRKIRKSLKKKATT